MSNNPYAPPSAPVADVEKPVDAGTLNPWFSMWTKPRATIAQIVARDPTHLVLPLAAISGFSQALDRASMRSAGDTLDLSVIFLFAAIGGAVGGIITLYLGGVLLRWTGSWIGGTATSQHIRAAVAWSGVPLVWALVLWVPELALFGKDLFTTETPRIDASVGMLLLFLGFAAIEVVVGAWAFVVALKSLGQVQGFSAWKALANGLLALLVVIGALVITVPLVLLVAGLT